jgi:hypothetical protein
LFAHDLFGRRGARYQDGEHERDQEQRGTSPARWPCSMGPQSPAPLGYELPAWIVIASAAFQTFAQISFKTL